MTGLDIAAPQAHPGQETAFTVSSVAEAVAAAIPDRTLLVHGDQQHSYAQVLARANRLATFLHAQGLGCHTERGELDRHEVGQDLLGIYAYNGNPFVESMLGSFRARVAPFNVNYRYVKDELAYLLADSGATALVYHGEFAPRLAEVLPALPRLRVLIQIADGSGNPLLDNAVDYESIVAEGPVGPPPVRPSPDDLYVLYTGGTTGMPKGVLWRQHDIFMSAFGGRDLASGLPVGTLDDIVARAETGAATKLMVLPPLMHGAAQWGVMCSLTMGQTVVFSPVTSQFDPDAVVATIEREQVFVASLVGDAMARPLVEAIEKSDADLSSLAIIGNGGAPLTAAIKQRLIDARPGLVVLDGVGSSETGAQLSHISVAGAVSTGTFKPGAATCVLSENLDAVEQPGHDGIGWLAQRGWVPLGYNGDAAKTAATFPVIDGVRYAVPGDRARHLDDETVHLLGRDSATINSGGEKVFAEEVEMAIASHPSVADVVVTGRDSDHWGQEVVAIVALTEAGAAESEELITHAAASLARYKLPKAILFRSHIERSPAGKADYGWARAQARGDDSGRNGGKPSPATRTDHGGAMTGVHPSTTSPSFHHNDLSSPTFWDGRFEQRDVVFAQLRAESGLSWHRPIESAFPHEEPGYWAVTRYADVRYVSQHSDLFISSRGIAIDPMPAELQRATTFFLTMDPPAHTRYRKLISAAFTPRQVRLIQEQIQANATQIVDDLLDKLRSGQDVDFVAECSAKLPMQTISAMIGIDPADHDAIAAAAESLTGTTDDEYSTTEDRAAHLMTQFALLTTTGVTLAHQRRQDPREDLMTNMVNAEIDGHRLSDDEIGAFLVLLSVAGNDTTKQATSHTFKALLEHPDQRDWLLADFDNRINAAIDEFIRWATPVMTFARHAVADTEVGGTHVKAGDKLALFYCSANRDATVFARPHEFDLTRSPNMHAGFGGGGTHFCLGAHLARMELRHLFYELLTRLPDITVGEPEYLHSMFIHGIKRMPIALA